MRNQNSLYLRVVHHVDGRQKGGHVAHILLFLSIKMATNITIPPSCEDVVDRLISRLQPSKESELRRLETIKHLQLVLSNNFGCRTLLFGSVAYKTYLPHGDIDVTIPCSDEFTDLQHLELIRAALEAHPEVQKRPCNVSIIRADVKVMKMVVNGFYVDISINQTGGLSTLCFLQEADNLIGQNHLFKRSLLLVKGWCHYESHILGSSGGLFGTFALTVMLLSIFNLFEGIDTPLKALYQFLAYYGTFNFDEDIVSMYGPLSMEHLHKGGGNRPKPVASQDWMFPCREEPLIPHDVHEKWCLEYLHVPAEPLVESPQPTEYLPPPDECTPTLFAHEIESPRSEEEKGSEDTPNGSTSGDSGEHMDALSSSSDSPTAVPPSNYDAVQDDPSPDWWRQFRFRNINVQDPLRPANNLGRSVTKANFLRIRQALLRGHHSLCGILSSISRQGDEAANNRATGLAILDFFPNVTDVCGFSPFQSPPVGNSLFDRMQDCSGVRNLPLCAQCHVAVGRNIFCMDVENLKMNLMRSYERPKIHSRYGEMLSLSPNMMQLPMQMAPRPTAVGPVGLPPYVFYQTPLGVPIVQPVARPHYLYPYVVVQQAHELEPELQRASAKAASKAPQGKQHPSSRGRDQHASRSKNKKTARSDAKSSNHKTHDNDCNAQSNACADA